MSLIDDLKGVLRRKERPRIGFDSQTAVAVGELNYGRRPDGSFGFFGNIIKTTNGGLEWSPKTFDDVGGLNVPMHNAVFMGVVECPQQLPHETYDAGQAK